MVDAGSISFVARSKRRKEVLKILDEAKQMSQTEIMRISDNYKSHNSRVLKELRGKWLISCVNPEDRSYKFYKITKKGRQALREAEKVSGQSK